MGTAPRVLVTGAGIAGPAAAYWLDKAGFDVTVIERAPTLRPGGQNIDVRGTGREVLSLMGLENAVRERNTGEIGTRFYDQNGTVVSEFGVDEQEGQDGPTAELEILRGALSQILVDACPESVRWRFGQSVGAVADTGSGVDITLSDGRVDSYELLVIAEGVGSHTRDLVFADQSEQRALGMYAAYGTIERAPQDDQWWNFLIAPGSRQVSLRPDDVGTTRAMLNFLADSPVLEGLGDQEVRAVLREKFSGLGWEVPRILDGFAAADDLYIDYLRQIVCPSWHRGRVVLLGDAAWCVTPVGGGGTSLAITGSYVLAAFLSQSDDVEEALTRYEEWMRPVVEEAQHLPPGVPRIAAPRTRTGVKALQWGTRLAARPSVRSLVERLTSGPQAVQDLPTLDRRPDPGRTVSSTGTA